MSLLMNGDNRYSWTSAVGTRGAATALPFLRLDLKCHLYLFFFSQLKKNKYNWDINSVIIITIKSTTH